MMYSRPQTKSGNLDRGDGGKKLLGKQRGAAVVSQYQCEAAGFAGTSISVTHGWALRKLVSKIVGAEDSERETS